MQGDNKQSTNPAKVPIDCIWSKVLMTLFGSFRHWPQRSCPSFNKQRPRSQLSPKLVLNEALFQLVKSNFEPDHQHHCRICTNYIMNMSMLNYQYPLNYQLYSLRFQGGLKNTVACCLLGAKAGKVPTTPLNSPVAPTEATLCLRDCELNCQFDEQFWNKKPEIVGFTVVGGGKDSRRSVWNTLGMCEFFSLMFPLPIFWCFFWRKGIAVQIPPNLAQHAARRRPSSSRRLGCLKPAALAEWQEALRPRHRWKLGCFHSFSCGFFGVRRYRKGILMVVGWCHFFELPPNWREFFGGLCLYRFWDFVAWEVLEGLWRDVEGLWNYLESLEELEWFWGSERSKEF